MKQTIFTKIKTFIRSKIRLITGHKYDCCNNIFENCSKCNFK